MILKLSGLFGAAVLFVLFVLVLALRGRRGIRARHSAFYKHTAALGLRQSTATVPNAEYNWVGTIDARDVIVGYYEPPSRDDHSLPPFPSAWIAIRVDVLDGTDYGAHLDVVPPKNGFRLIRAVDAAGAAVVEPLITPRVLTLATGMQDLTLKANRTYLPGAAMDYILRDAWGDGWTGAVLQGTIAADADTATMHAAIGQLASVAGALEAP